MDNIKLGFKDIIKNFKIFILFGIFLSIIALIIVSSTMSLIYALNESKLNFVTYRPIPVETGLENFSNIKYRLDDFYKKGTFSVFRLNDFNENKFSGFIAVGNIQKKVDDKIFFLVDKNNFKNLKLKDFEIVNKDEVKDSFIDVYEDFFDENTIFLKSSNNKYNSILDFKLNDNELLDLIENTRFSSIDLKNKLDLEFENIIDNSEVLFKKQEKNSKEVGFILNYIYLYSFLLILSLILYFNVFLKNIYSKLIKEYKIHIIFGSTNFSIFIRNSMFSLFLVITSFLIINLLNKFYINTIFYINLVISLMYFFVLELVILLTLRKEDLNSIVIEGE